MDPQAESVRGRRVGRYALFEPIASGGMATVHLARLLGPGGFSRTVAIKRLHTQYARNPEFVAMFLDEARLCGRVRHSNVVTVLDVVALDGELFLVMDYVQGEVLSKLLRAARAARSPPPPNVLTAILAGVLHGLDAAHEAKSERGEPLHIVHRDVSPQNIIVGADGTARVLDFGVAKAARRLQETHGTMLKGKLRYMAPEQVTGQGVDRRTDVFAAAVVTWEALAGRRLFDAHEPALVLQNVLHAPITPLSAIRSDLPAAVDDVVLRGLSRNPDERYATAREMAIALEEAMAPATATQVGGWVESLLGAALHARAARLREIEAVSVVEAAPRRFPISVPLSDDSDPSLAVTTVRASPDADATQLNMACRPTSDLQDPGATAEQPRVERDVALDGAGGADLATERAPPPSLEEDAWLPPAEDAWLPPISHRRRTRLWVGAILAGGVALLLVALIRTKVEGARALPKTALSAAPPGPSQAEHVDRSQGSHLAHSDVASPSAVPSPPAATSASDGPTLTPDDLGTLPAAAVVHKPVHKASARRTHERVRAPAPPKSAGAHEAAANCDPPYSLDEAGNKHFKPECL